MDLAQRAGRQAVSGCEDADWAALGLMVDGVFSWVFFPITDLTIDRDWRMAGMRGTGSHTLVAEDLVVPAGQVAPSVPFTPNDLLLYGISVLGPVLGAAAARPASSTRCSPRTASRS